MLQNHHKMMKASAKSLPSVTQHGHTAANLPFSPPKVKHGTHKVISPYSISGAAEVLTLF
jgi:hypothetical protein